MLNFLLFVGGMYGVGIVTDWNGWALFWTTIASIHVTVRNDENLSR